MVVDAFTVRTQTFPTSIDALAHPRVVVTPKRNINKQAPLQINDKIALGCRARGLDLPRLSQRYGKWQGGTWAMTAQAISRTTIQRGALTQISRMGHLQLSEAFHYYQSEEKK